MQQTECYQEVTILLGGGSNTCFVLLGIVNMFSIVFVVYSNVQRGVT
jgi:hypothetical protein